METEEKLQIIEEIKRIERELYLKKSKLASVESMEYGVRRPDLLAQGLDTKKWKEVFSELIKIIGMHSAGGDSVEDIQKERKE